ncbi:ribonuclease H-like domain-containing protein [Desulfovibrio gilichinskyi]|uniref:Predicted 3'-5' exonuclease PolB-like domain-containing protein n=1 Tax=Desulfovibrio gilichinskyi TaxID=1519643 RepID=A0A1X7C3J7_9BACT|nr:ribonuclease H-like domain-containing protein [Desulfovibrio gilichinskyi]SME89236.1 hypothetical protein SAMN06295933_0258 [Desulfovibrio gilichinskyi]
MIELFIDIETIPGAGKPKASEVKAPGQMKKAETIKAWLAENKESALDELWKKQSLISLKGRIICTGFAVGDNPVESLCWENEEDLLKTMWAKVQEQNKFQDEIRWVGFNIKPFDMNWLYHRAVKFGMKDLAAQISRKRYCDSIVDIREVWNGADYQAKGTADEIAEFLGVKRKTEGMDGSKVFGLWQQGKLSEIASYCGDDVESAREMYRKMEGTF